MQLTKGAIGNLINRYKAVLKKCHLLNVFGSLAVAGMLVMGGAAAAGAATDWTDKEIINQEISKDGSYLQGGFINNTSWNMEAEELKNTKFLENKITITGSYLQGGIIKNTHNANLEITSSEFSKNTITAEGNYLQGGIINNDGASVNISEGSKFNNNIISADSYLQGGIINNNDGRITINGAEFSENRISASNFLQGGIIINDGNTINISNAKFIGNTVDSEGKLQGGIIINDAIGGKSTISISNSEFKSNKVNSGDKLTGGIIFNDCTNNGDYRINIDTVVFSQNEVNSEGSIYGAIINNSEDHLITINSSSFEGNISVAKGEEALGGAIYNAGELKFTGINTFANNTLNGVANDIYNLGTITVADGTTSLGGGLTLADGTVTVTDSGTLDGTVTWENGSGEASKGLIVIESDGTTASVTLNGGMGTGENASASVDSVSAQDLNVTLDGIKASNNVLATSDTGAYKNTGIVKFGSTVGNGDTPVNLTVTQSKFKDNTLTVTATNGTNTTAGGAAISFDPNDSTTNSNLIISESTFEKNTFETTHVTAGGSYGGAIGVQDNTAVELTDVILNGNTAKSNNNAQGGGYYQANRVTGTLSAQHVTATNNTADGALAQGGGMALFGVEASIADSTFTENLAKGDTAQGGAIYNEGTLTVEGSTFTGNKAEGTNGWGGAIYNAGTLTVDGTRFENNTASAQGGAIYVHPKAELDVTNSYFKGNGGTAGGAIAMFGDNGAAPEHSISNTVFEGNTADRTGDKLGKGGAIAILQMDTPKEQYTTKLDLNGVTFIGNTSNGTGGAIHSEYGTLTITDATFSGNSAEQQGGAIYNDANSSITFKGTNTFSGNTAAEGKDIYNAGSLTMSSGSDLVVYGSGSILNAAGGNINVENGARLTIADAVSGGTYTVVSGEGDISFNGGDYNAADSTGWKGENLQASSDMFILTSTDGMTFTAQGQDAHDVFTGLDDGLADAVNNLYARHGAPRNGWNYADVDAEERGIRFLSRATDKRFIGADHQAAAATIESAARIAFAGAVPQMTKMASDAGTNAVVNRLGFADPVDGAQAMDAEGKIVDRNTTGFALWIAPLWQNQHGWGMEAGNLDYGFNGNLGGVSLGADYTFENAIRAGITFNIGGGYAESSGGDLNSTENRMTFWGLGAYAGWNYENFGLMADVSYTSTWNDLEQDMDGRMGMSDLEADVQATAISAGLRAEYKLETSVLDIIPHIGVRYMSLNTWGYDVDTNGGTVLEGDGFHQDIWTFPIGVTFSKDFTLDSGWFFKPSVDFSVIPAAGDIKAKQDVAFTGLPGTYEVETQMMDYLTWQGGVGTQMGNDNLSFGVNYTLQAGQNTTGHGVFGSFRYEF